MRLEHARTAYLHVEWPRAAGGRRPDTASKVVEGLAANLVFLRPILVVLLCPIARDACPHAVLAPDTRSSGRREVKEGVRQARRATSWRKWEAREDIIVRGSCR